MAAEEEEGESECGPSYQAVALLYEDATGRDVYFGIDTDPVNVPLLPIRRAVLPPHVGSCQRRHGKFHAAEGVHEPRLSGSGQKAATSLAGALERF